MLLLHDAPDGDVARLKPTGGMPSESEDEMPGKERDDEVSARDSDVNESTDEAMRSSNDAVLLLRVFDPVFAPRGLRARAAAAAPPPPPPPAVGGSACTLF